MGKPTCGVVIVGAPILGAACADAFAACPGYRTVCLATGPEGRGIPRSLGTARLRADQIAGMEPDIAVEPSLRPRTVQEYAHA